MEEVFVVTTGEYSDYSISAIFTDRDLAVDYINSFTSQNWYSFNDIEVYKLNPYKFELQNGYKPFTVLMDIEGKTLKCSVSEVSNEWNHNNEKLYRINPNNEMYSYVYAKDQKHAIKITNERRIQLIALNIWKHNA